MQTPEVNVVTGAFGYTGKYIARRLLAMGKRVRTFTGHPGRTSPFEAEVDVFPYSFDSPNELTDSLRGATTLYNTYWIRFPHGQLTYDKAVENTRTLIRAAEAAGVRKLVHISITHADEDLPLPYFRGKGQVEKAIISSGLSYAIIRPTVIFGPEGILINNIAWLAKKFPLFAVFGSGDYRVQPVFVEDVAEIAVNAGQSEGNLVIDAIGPEVYTFDGLVRLIIEKTRSRAKVMHLPPSLAFFLARLVGYMVRDRVITRDEIEGLMANLLVSDSLPTGKTRLSAWLEANAGIVGARYASELSRHYR